nr:hypothetical protein [Saprospiraceae bacterium]
MKLLWILSLAFLVLPMSCKTQDNGTFTQPRAYDIFYLEETGKKLDTSNETKNARTINLVGADQLLFVHSRETATVITYTLMEAGDVSSAVLSGVFNTSDYLGSKEEESKGHGIYLRRDALDRVWLYNRTEIWQFDLPIAGDMQSAVCSGYRDLSDRVKRGHDIDFNLEGNRFYVDDRNSESVFQYTVKEPWNINTIEFDYELDISETHSAVRGIEFRPDGKLMYLLDTSQKEIQQFALSEAWELRTAVFEKKYPLRTNNPRGFTWNEDGSRAYVMDATSGIIYQFHIRGN